MVAEAREQVRRDALAARVADDGVPLRDSGKGATAYAEAVGVYLAALIDQLANHQTTICGWHVNNTQLRNTFARQALPMTWDYAESNPFCTSTGSYHNLWHRQIEGFSAIGATQSGVAWQADAAVGQGVTSAIISTDPPYYDNIGYADLSDFFHVWLRRSLRSTFPELLATLAAPKAEELVANPYRHGTKAKAEAFFLDGMTRAMRALCEQTHPAFPVTIYYAFKQSERRDDQGVASTGWQTFLEAVITAGFAINGTWPMRTEMSNRMIGRETNALASSIVLVCRPRTADAPSATRRELQETLRSEFPKALADLQRSNIAPVDLAQASIGPGMAIFTRYKEVLNADGSKMSVGDALALINATLDEALTEQEGDFDSDQPLGADLVRAARLYRGRVWHRRAAVEGQEHQRRRARPRRHH